MTCQVQVGSPKFMVTVLGFDQQIYESWHRSGQETFVYCKTVVIDVRCAKTRSSECTFETYLTRYHNLFQTGHKWQMPELFCLIIKAVTVSQVYNQYSELAQITCNDLYTPTSTFHSYPITVTDKSSVLRWSIMSVIITLWHYPHWTISSP